MSKNVRMHQEINRSHISLSSACVSVPVEVQNQVKNA